MPEAVFNGMDTYRKHRIPIMTDATFCGRINKTLSLLKENYPDKQIIILTPIHRGDFIGSSTNVQPNENYANGIGLYLEEYVETLKKAAAYWSVPVIDLNALSGIFPVSDAFLPYCTGETDRLHPNAKGHYQDSKNNTIPVADVAKRFLVFVFLISALLPVVHREHPAH